MNKHMYSDIFDKEHKVVWHTPVELISAHENKNVDTIFHHALEMRETMGAKNLELLRQSQMHRGMWSYLGESLMTELKSAYKNKKKGSSQIENKYADVIVEVETQLLKS